MAVRDSSLRALSGKRSSFPNEIILSISGVKFYDQYKNYGEGTSEAKVTIKINEEKGEISDLKFNIQDHEVPFQVNLKIKGSGSFTDDTLFIRNGESFEIEISPDDLNATGTVKFTENSGTYIIDGSLSLNSKTIRDYVKDENKNKKITWTGINDAITASNAVANDIVLDGSFGSIDGLWAGEPNLTFTVSGGTLENAFEKRAEEILNNSSDGSLKASLKYRNEDSGPYNEKGILQRGALRTWSVSDFLARLDDDAKGLAIGDEITATGSDLGSHIHEGVSTERATTHWLHIAGFWYDEESQKTQVDIMFGHYWAVMRHHYLMATEMERKTFSEGYADDENNEVWKALTGTDPNFGSLEGDNKATFDYINLVGKV